MTKLTKNTPSINGSSAVQERMARDNGHTVTVVTRFVTHSQGTVMAKIANWCSTEYKCDCGVQTFRYAKKSNASITR
jgi:hypothetical protein